MHWVIAKVCKGEVEKKLFKKFCREIRENPNEEIDQERLGCLDATATLEEVDSDIKGIFTEAEIE